MTDQTISFRSLAFLVVADDESTRDLLHFALETFQAEDVQDAANVPEALRALGAFVPDVVLTEMSLSSDGGARMVLPLHAIGRRLNPTTAVLVLTGRALEIDILRAIRAGADDVIRWPFSAHFLSQRIARALARRRTGSRTLHVVPRANPPRKPYCRSPEWPNLTKIAACAYQQDILTREEIRALTTDA